jgi:DNA-binding CsgD family transcriptional regulator
MKEPNHLSGREIEILQLVAKGLTNREIAQKLTISPNTVKVHLRNIFEKISVASRTEATMYSIEHGLVAVPQGREVLAVQPGWREMLRKYVWLGVPLLLLVALFFVTFSLNVLNPPSTPEQQVMAAVADRWRELAALPVARAGMAAAAYDGQVYAIAGSGPEGVSDSVFRYTPEADRWAQLSDKPTPVTDVVGVFIGEKIYVPGGRAADGQPVNVLEIYDPRRDTWSTGAALPKAVSAYALADYEGQMYLFGGWDGVRALDDVFVYDPQANEWREATPMTAARQNHSAAALRDKIIVLGGRNPDGILSSAVSYFPSRDAAGEDPWEPFVDLPEARYGFATASSGESLYIFGGSSDAAGEADLPFAYQLTGFEWRRIPVDLGHDGSIPALVGMGLQVYFMSAQEPDSVTRLWRYQAFFEIFLPIIQ